MNGRPRPVLIAPRLLPASKTPTLEKAVELYLAERRNDLKPTSFRPLRSLLQGSLSARSGGRPRCGTPLTRGFLARRKVGRAWR